MRLRIVHPAAVSIDGARAPVAEDREAMADLMLDAYRGTIDDEGETLADAMAEVDRTFTGEYGEFLGPCSRVVVRDGRLASACLITLFEGKPWVSVSMTRSSWKRKGLARALLTACLKTLADNGYEEIGLMVTEGNLAEDLYRSLGFETVST